jgi:hypothetical protein
VFRIPSWAYRGFGSGFGSEFGSGFGHDSFDETGDGAFAFSGVAYFRAGGEGAELGIGGDLFDNFDLLGFGVLAGQGFGEVETGDLEAVEEEPGAAGINVVGGDALENLPDGLLDRGTVFGEREVEGGAALALVRVVDGPSGGVVVVAEVFSAEARAAATATVGEDVAGIGSVLMLWFRRR